MFSAPDLKDCTDYCDQSYGRGFINNILTWFPELEKSKVLEEAMVKAVSANVKKSRRTHDHCVALMKMRCSCSLCGMELGSHWGGSRTVGARAAGSSKKNAMMGEVGLKASGKRLQVSILMPTRTPPMTLPMTVTSAMTATIFLQHWQRRSLSLGEVLQKFH
jgi:hypothetical protein